MTELRAAIDRHEELLLRLMRLVRELQQVRDQHSQAILELAAALREAGINPEGVALPSTSEDSIPPSQSVEAVTHTA